MFSFYKSYFSSLINFESLSTEIIYILFENLCYIWKYFDKIVCAETVYENIKKISQLEKTYLQHCNIARLKPGFHINVRIIPIVSKLVQAIIWKRLQKEKVRDNPQSLVVLSGRSKIFSSDLMETTSDDRDNPTCPRMARIEPRIYCALPTFISLGPGYKFLNSHNCEAGKKDHTLNSKIPKFGVKRINS